MAALTDKKLESSVAVTLLIGVLLSALVVAVGGVLYLRHPLSLTPDYKHFHTPSPALGTVTGAWRGVLRGDAPSLIQLGLMVLIATPVARVALCLLGFARQKDKIYVLISTAVLAILLYSLFAGGR